MPGATERFFLAAPFPIGGRGVVVSPFQFATSGEENLRIESVGSLTGVRVAVHYRYWTPTGGIQANTQFHTPHSDRTIARSDFQLGAGALLNLTVFADAGSPHIGQTFVRIQIVRGLSGATIVLGTLLQGYVTGSQDLGWPGSPIQSSIEGGGVLRAVTGTQPAAGQIISETVPTGARWELLAIAADLTTSAVAGDRRPRLHVTRAAGRVAASPQAGVQPPSKTQTHYWETGVPLAVELTDNANVAGLPVPTLLLAGESIQVFVDTLAASDQWSAPRLSVREWLEAA